MEDDGRSSVVSLWRMLQWYGLREIGIASVVESHGRRELLLLRDGCCWRSKTGGGEPPECGVQMGRPCLMVCRSAAGTRGLLGYDRPELHVQSGTVVTDPEARDCVISGRADCRIRGGFGGGTTLSQQPCPGNQSTKLSNEPHDVFCMRKKTSRWIGHVVRVVCSWPYLAR